MRRMQSIYCLHLGLASYIVEATTVFHWLLVNYCTVCSVQAIEGMAHPCVSYVAYNIRCPRVQTQKILRTSEDFLLEVQYFLLPGVYLYTFFSAGEAPPPT